jgi:RNA polymerase sigma-70 factor (ECF subfamily)
VDAEDVVQNVLFNLAKGLPGFVYDPQRGKFRDYLFRATRNSITDWTRRTIGSPQALDTDVARTLASPTDESEGGDVALWEKEWVAHHYRLALLRARDEFEPRNLEIFERNVAGASVTELAVAYGIEEGSIYASRRRIRQRLRELIAEQVREEEA